MYKYYLAYDDGDMLIRDAAGVPIQRFDTETRKWVDDWDMCGIYSGDIPVHDFTEEEANKRIAAGQK